DKEHGDVVADEVPVALARVELYGEASYVACKIGGPLAPRHGGEPHERRCAFARPLEQVGSRYFGQRLVVLEEPVSPIATRVDDSLGDPLVVEVEELFPEVEILEGGRSAVADP